MKKLLLFCLTLILISTTAPAYAVFDIKPVAVENDAETNAKKVAAESIADWKNMSRKEKRAKRKTLRKQLKKFKKDKKKNRAADDTTILLVILAILIPPVAMFLFEDGITNRFWISLLLTILFFIPGMIYTLIVILGD